MGLVLNTPIDVVIIPGCPSEEDGRLSACQWRRVLWADHLYMSGKVAHFVTSGSAVQNRYVEADALAAGLIALGVPESAILREPNALHSDQNIACSLAMIDDMSFTTVGVASDALQAPGLCAMVRAWSGHACTPLSLDVTWTNMRFAAGVPVVATRPIPADRWLPLREREDRIYARTGYRRGGSWAIYISKSILNVFGLSHAPPLPPTLDSLLAE